MPLRAPAPFRWDRLPITLQFAEQPKFIETYGFSGSRGAVMLEGQRFVPAGRPSDTVFLFMHPSSTLQLLPMPAALAEAGLHVMCCGSRYARNDAALIMEKVARDLAEYIRHARAELGYKKVVLVGWSGGGSLSLFYQSEAEHPTITHTPAGDPYDLTAMDLPSADGIVFIAAHLSRAEVLTEFMDPSVLDERDPDRRDGALDIYDRHCPSQPPYNAEFVARFRAAQLARNRRITGWADEMLDYLRRKNDGEMERGFVVHRTMCDVRWLEPAIDPNGRKPGWSYLGEPRIANAAPAGLARFSSLRSWLSQWSFDRSRAKSTACAPHVRAVPVLQIENEADDAVPATHAPAVHAALGTADKQLVSIPGATHYYQGQPELLRESIETVIRWARERRLLD
jgi:pimeloyl-ACP methyl ester carboxylesterase